MRGYIRRLGRPRAGRLLSFVSRLYERDDRRRPGLDDRPSCPDRWNDYIHRPCDSAGLFFRGAFASVT